MTGGHYDDRAGAIRQDLDCVIVVATEITDAVTLRPDKRNDWAVGEDVTLVVQAPGMFRPGRRYRMTLERIP